VFARRAGSVPRGIVSKRVDDTYRSGPSRVSIKVRSPASIGCSGSAARSNPQFHISADQRPCR
jgi:hypothetical protein